MDKYKFGGGWLSGSYKIVQLGVMSWIFQTEPRPYPLTATSMWQHLKDSPLPPYDPVATHLIETRIMANMRYFPSRGTTREVGGMISTTSRKNTWREMRMEMLRVTCGIGKVWEAEERAALLWEVLHTKSSSSTRPGRRCCSPPRPPIPHYLYKKCEDCEKCHRTTNLSIICYIKLWGNNTSCVKIYLSIYLHTNTHTTEWSTTLTRWTVRFRTQVSTFFVSLCS